MRWAISTAAALAGLICAGAAFGQEGAAAPGPDIAVAELGAVDPFLVGVAPALPDSVWSSGDAAALDAALAQLPDRAAPGWRDAAAARLAARALRSSGEPPRGGEDDFALAALRADRLLAASRAHTTYELLARTPRVNESGALSRVFADAALALGRTDEACRAADALLEGREAAYWLRVRATCLALNGAIPAAELTAELARAQSPDSGFDALFDAFTLGRPAPQDAAPRTALELALMAAVSPEARITPAEDAPAWLKDAADRTGPPIALPELLPEALEAAVALEGADRAVALGALIQQDLDREIAAEALAIRLGEAAASGRFVEVAWGYGPEVARLPITADTLAHGPAFVLAALIADDVVAAAQWRDALMDGPPVPEPVSNTAPGSLTVPAAPGVLTPPPGYAEAEPETPWEPPAPSVMVALDFAHAIAVDQVRDDVFMALLTARLEGATPERLCQAAALVALGADDQGQLRTAMSGLVREPDAPAPLLAPAMLAAGAGALGETQLHAAHLLEQHDGDAEVCAAAALALDHAGLRDQALRYVLERVVEEAA